MKRLLVITLILTLVLALAMPGVAFAKRGGVPANGKGHAAATAPTTGDEDAVKDKTKDKVKDKTAVEGDDEATDEEAEEADDAEEAEEAEDQDEEATEEAPEKLTGIENALSRLQRNLERKSAKFAEGVEAVLPAGLQNTIAKFMSWLGIDPEETAEDVVEGQDSEESTPTPEPELPDDTLDEGAPEL